jgi:TetR/AcrR family transcriptional repressor of lmrAB and yxaGH operons
MGKATDTRQRMIDGATELVRRHGYGATSFKDIWEHTGTPRGSVYFHFPAGKEELGLEVLTAAATQLASLTRQAGSRTRTPETFIRGLAKALADEMENSDYLNGCAILAISAEASPTSPSLRAAAASAFQIWSTAIAVELERKALPAADAALLAGVLLSGLEGARVVAKAARSRASLEQAGGTLALLPAALRHASAR